MAKKISSVIMVCAMIGVYIIFFNLLPSMSGYIDDSGISSSLVSSGGTDEKIGVSDSVSITVKAKRFYGTVYSTGTFERVSVLYILGFIPLPLKVANINFGYLHAIFFISMALLLIFLLLKSERGEITYERKTMV